MEEKWLEHRCEHFDFEGHEAMVVFPKQPNGYLVVKTEYWDAFQEAAEEPLLQQGFHLCYIENDNRWGTDADIERKTRFIRYVQAQYGLKEKCVVVGMSCGGLIAIKMAARYPELVQCMYLEAPVLNFMSCPCGYGVGRPLQKTGVEEILGALQMESISELLYYRDMPLDRLPELVQHRIPVVMSAGDSDPVVPYCENGICLERAYQEAGIEIEVYMKPGGLHHPHGLPDPTPVVDFLLRHCPRD